MLSQSSTPSAFADASNARAYTQELIERTNAERVSRGLPPLKLESHLNDAAMWIAQDTADYNYLNHTDRFGRTISERFPAFGYTGYGAIGENLAAGYATPSIAIQGWLNSPGHRANLLNAQYREVGVGYGFNSGSTYSHYWAQTFGTRNDVYPLIINNEVAQTTSANVSLYIYGSPWAQQMRLSNDGSQWTAWETYQSSHNWTIAEGTGTKTVYVELRNGGTVRQANDSIGRVATTPNPPANLAADTITANGLRLTWQDLADNEDAFRVYRQSTATGAFELIATVGANTPSYNDTQLQCNLAYAYQVAAYNAAGEARSPVLETTTRSCPAPTTPDQLQVSGTTNTSVTLSWYDQSPNEQGFRIYKWKVVNGVLEFYEHATVGANQTSYTETGLTCGSDYFYQVSAYNNEGESARTPWIRASTSVCPTNTPTPLVDADIYEPDNSAGEARSMTNGQRQAHSIAPIGDHDWVSFLLLEDSAVVVETSGTTGDTVLRLYASDMLEIAYHDDIGQGNLFSRITRSCENSALPAGTYFVQVGDFGDNSQIGSYTLALTTTSCAHETPTNTPSPTTTSTPSPTTTSTPSSTATNTPDATSDATATITPTTEPTATAVETISATATKSPAQLIRTDMYLPMVAAEPPTPTATATPLPTATSTATATPTSTVTPVPTNRPDGPPAAQALARANYYRTLAGIPPLRSVAAIEQAALNHAQYYVANHKSPGAFPNGNPHGEVAGFPGFTGAHFWERMIHTGYTNRARFEVMHFINDPTIAVDDWVATVYHRVPFIDPRIDEVGYGGASKNGAAADVMDFGYSGDNLQISPDRIIIYPANNQVDIPRAWDCRESPNPYADEGCDGQHPVGYVITVLGMGNQQFSKLEMRTADGQTVSMHPLRVEGNLAFTAAKAPLAANTTYIVLLTGLDNQAKPLELEWRFTTNTKMYQG